MTELGSSSLYGAPSVLPFYIVCDESSSMAGGSIQAVNDGIAKVFDAIYADPIVDEKVRVGIVTFSDTARILLPLTQLSDVTQIPECVAGGTSSYTAAFRLLKTQLETDITNLRQQFNVHRPLIFFVSNGRPNNENWRDELNSLIDPDFFFRPHVVGIGVTGAEKSVVEDISHWEGVPRMKVFFTAESGGNPGDAIVEFIKPVFQFVIVSRGSRWPTRPFVVADNAVIQGRSTENRGVVRMHVVSGDS